jgi:hypothetical protein
VWTLLRVAFSFGLGPTKTGDTGCSRLGGASHENE